MDDPGMEGEMGEILTVIKAKLNKNAVKQEQKQQTLFATTAAALDKAAEACWTAYVEEDMTSLRAVPAEALDALLAEQARIETAMRQAYDQWTAERDECVQAYLAIMAQRALTRDPPPTTSSRPQPATDGAAPFA